MPLLMGRARSARTRRFVNVACGVAAAAATAVVVVSLCFFIGTEEPSVASGLGKVTAAAAAGAGAAGAGAHPGDQEAVVAAALGYAGRRLLSGGLGSHPPRCTSKCGSCSPCYPVHVSVPPGVLVTTEYYPEAWRCKCRNQLYMP